MRYRFLSVAAVVLALVGAGSSTGGAAADGRAET